MNILSLEKIHFFFLILIGLILPLHNSWSNLIPEIETSPGFVALVRFRERITPDQTFSCFDKTQVVSPWKEQSVSFVPISYGISPQKVDCFLISAKERKKVVVLNIKKFDYPEEALTVQKNKLVLSKKNLKRVILEREKLNQAYSQNDYNLLFTTTFERPVQADISSHYGKQRVYNGFKKSPHLGTDFRTVTGTEVFSSNRGKVVLVEDLFFTGNTVIVWHGGAIYSVYAHLSKNLIKVGEMVEKGQLLGLSGATGRVSGPHLHWGIKLQEEWVDGQSLIDATLELESESQKTKDSDTR